MKFSPTHVSCLISNFGSSAKSPSPHYMCSIAKLSVSSMLWLFLTQDSWVED